MSYDIRSKLIVSQNLLVQATITGLVCLKPPSASPVVRVDYYNVVPYF